MEKKINDFIIFCMEIYKGNQNLTGKEVYDLFEEYDLFNYLHNGYDILHTQGSELIKSDIDKYLNLRGYNNNTNNKNLNEDS